MYCYALVVPNLGSRKRVHVIDLDFDSNSQQTLKCIAEEVEIKDLTPLDDIGQPLPPHVSSRVNGESTYQVVVDKKSTLVSAKVMARYLLAKEKLRKHLKLITM